MGYVAVCHPVRQSLTLFQQQENSEITVSFEKNLVSIYLSVVNFWKFLSETEWNGSVYPGWYNQLQNFMIYYSICYMKFLKFQTGIFGQMESAHDHQDETSLLPIIK